MQSIYLDTGRLAGLLIEADIFASRATTAFADTPETLIVSDFAATEFASVVARGTRMNQITESKALTIFDSFDTWLYLYPESVPADPADIQAAAAIIRRLDLNIRAPDAIHLAIARRIGASIVTFDHRMADNAPALGIAVAAV